MANLYATLVILVQLQKYDKESQFHQHLALHQCNFLHYRFISTTVLIYCIRWRLESAATREHLVDAAKTRNVSSPLPPQWHKRLCARLTNAYAHYVEKNILFSGFQVVPASKPRAFNER